ncbi:MAG: PBP1A family penicillin-binding protein [Patescibacteria group bacterium]
MKQAFVYLKPKNLRNSFRENRWKTIRILSLYFAAFFVLFVAGVFLYFAKDLPDANGMSDRVVAESTKIMDRTGQHVLYEVHGEEKRTIIPFSEMPDNLKYATIALEDQDFYSHHGIKFTSIIRAALKDVIGGGVSQGGSTITQQFVKKSMLTDEKTLSRKIKEVILALELETKYSKDEILGMYLNQIPYGSNSYGIQAAAQTFFGKDAKDLTLDEAALLATLPQAPTYYSPYGLHADVLKTRQQYALKRMKDLGYISEDQENQYKDVDVLAKIRPYQENIDAPHFVMYIKEYLEKKYGTQAVEQGGLKVYTTLDWDKQQIAEQAVKDGAEKNKKNWNAYNASLIAMDPKTGQVLAMVGSKDFFGKSEPEGCISGKNCKFEPQDNVTVRDRQPGSSFKPYVYLTAFEKGYTPETIMFDTETNFGTQGAAKDYIPQDYDGKFRGPLPMKETLAQSLNIPAVKTLYLAGVKNSIATAKSMGITGLNNPDRLGLSLVLGGGEVKLIDHVSAFSTLATGGIKRTRTAILKIEDSKGNALEEYKPDTGERVVEEKYAAMIDYIMSTNDFRAPIFGENSPLRFDNRPVAAKTGTTNEFRDGWTIGYTPSVAVGVWAGNNDNTPMRAGADGVNVAAPIWRSFLDKILGNYSMEQFPKYEKEDAGKDILNGKMPMEENVKVCEIPGKDKEYCLANNYCTDTKKKDFADTHDILYYVNKDDPRGDIPQNPGSDSQFDKWEKGVKKWFDKNNKDYISGGAPKNECTAEDFKSYQPSISSVSASQNLSVLSISSEISAPYEIDKIEFYVNGDKIDTKISGSTSYSMPAALSGKSNVEVKVTVTDKNGNMASSSKKIDIAVW